MNAKDFFTDKNGGKTPEEMNESDLYCSNTFVVKLMKEYALQVATEAVEEEVNNYDNRTPEWINAKYHGHYILENIKKRLE